MTPGPGQYGVSGTPDPVITGKTTPFGKMRGGRVSTSPLRAHTDAACRVSKSVPGPGSYDCDHIFGIYGRIRAGIPENRGSFSPAEPEEVYMGDSDDSDAPSPAGGFGYMQSPGYNTFP